MKKLTASFLAVIIAALTLFTVTSFASSEPEFMLAADYNESDSTILVYYRLLNFVGTESADFRLKYDGDALELIDSEKTAEKMDNVFIEMNAKSDPNEILIQFVDMYCVTAADCEEDGSATVMLFKFKIKDPSVKKTSFIATEESYCVDPNSTEISLNRATLQVALDKGSVQTATVDGYDFPETELKGKDIAAENNSEANSGVTDENRAKIKKVIIAAVITAIVFVAALVAIVLKYRTPENDGKDNKKKGK